MIELYKHLEIQVDLAGFLTLRAELLARVGAPWSYLSDRDVTAPPGGKFVLFGSRNGNYPDADPFFAWPGDVAGIPEITETAFGASCAKVLEKFIAVAIRLKTPNAAKLMARNRVIDGTAPAGSEKQSFKDCLVLESCVETLSAARIMGCTESAMFPSRSSTEYTTDKALHKDLTGEFANPALEYGTTFAELRDHHTIKDL